MIDAITRQKVLNALNQGHTYNWIIENKIVGSRTTISKIVKEAENVMNNGCFVRYEDFLTQEECAKILSRWVPKEIRKKLMGLTISD